jgi:hypothetical protein
VHRLGSTWRDITAMTRACAFIDEALIPLRSTVAFCRAARQTQDSQVLLT